jgi:hypothetical protein
MRSEHWGPSLTPVTQLTGRSAITTVLHDGAEKLIEVMIISSQQIYLAAIKALYGDRDGYNHCRSVIHEIAIS